METNENVITAYFEADHDRLETLLNQYRKKKHENVKEAKPYFRFHVFSCGIDSARKNKK